jgi:hypothetical protein
MPGRSFRLPIRLIASIYVLAVAVLATLGFTVGSAAIILVTAFLTLPSSIVAVPGYYIAYGLLAQVPGANPSHSRGSASCDSHGVCDAVTTGDPASWFTLTTDVIGASALIAAGVLNLVLLRRVVASRRIRAEVRRPRT